MKSFLVRGADSVFVFPGAAVANVGSKAWAIEACEVEAHDEVCELCRKVPRPAAAKPSELYLLLAARRAHQLIGEPIDRTVPYRPEEWVVGVHVSQNAIEVSMVL